MPTSFYITKLRVHAHGHLGFEGEAKLMPGVNVLIGKNGLGKTSVLQMIRAASEGNHPSQTENELAAVDGDVLSQIWLERGVEGPTTIERRKQAQSWSGWESLQQRVRFVTSNRSLRNEMKTRGMLSGFQRFDIGDPADELNVADEFNKAMNSELLERLKEIEGGLDPITSHIEDEYRRGLVDLDKDIRLDFERDNPVYFLDHRQREIDISMLSAGEKEFLYFFAYLRRIRSDRDKVILIDEPELHLHGNQVRKLCEMLSGLAAENQVLVATHSSDVLHHFLHSGNIIQLGAGRIRNVDFPEDMRNLMDQVGLPIDPSVFTAHWIAAENKDSSRLPGERSPVTAEVLSWIFGKSLTRRFWGFGTSRASAEGAIEMLRSATAEEGDLQLSIILDGDRLVSDVNGWPPDEASRSPGGRIHYLPYWELENVFLNPSLLDRVLDDQGGSGRLWKVLEERSEELVRTCTKTIMKNLVNRARSENRIDRQPAEELAAFQKAIAELPADPTAVATRVRQLLDEQDWRWIPGKEALGYLVGAIPDFWTRLSQINLDDLKDLLQTDQALAALVAEVSAPYDLPAEV